ncbi:MAG: peptidylprolyl isomerase [Flavobacteriales bacterium]|nr:peptidylprolyl isomerase [Flavobacteriales bacterium]MCB9363700.1 peptidylprolyl isomerase [Flavobacteriales bacterium]
MAVIGKIREKSGLVMVVIGIGMIGFLFQDAAKSLFSGSNDNSVGEIGDVQVSGVEFNAKYEEGIARWESQNRTAATEQIRESVREQVWNDIVRERVLGSQIAELGLTVSPQELFDMVQGNNPHPQVKQAFSNPQTGEFSSAQVLQFLKSLETMPVENKNQWLLFEEGIQKERISSKYFNLVKKGMYAPAVLTKRTYKEQNEKRNIQFVAKRYFTVADSSITVTEAEKKAYYTEHKNEFKQDASREIEYIKYDVTPSEADIAETKKWIEETFTEYKASANDSAYVMFNSDVPFDANYYTEANMPTVNDSNFFYAEVGTMVGPYEEGNAYVIAKLSNVKMVPDSVKARHILLKTTQQPTDTLLKAKLDSIKGVIEKGGNFAEIAKEVSEDVGSAIEGGDLGWFKEGQMVPEFNDACFNGKKGDLTIVQTRFGFHLIEVQDQGEKVRKVQVGRIVRNIEPSNETYDAVFAEASAFYSENNSSANFTKATESGEIIKRVAEVKVNDKTIAGLESPRELIRWAFNNDKGSVSAPFQFEKSFVIAHLAEVKEEGIAPMEQVEIQVELGAKKAKKAQQFMAEMAGATNLQDLAAKIGGQVEKAKSVTFANYSVPGMGQEPRIIGMVSTLQKGQMSVPLEGQTGVFVVMVEDEVPAEETTDYSAAKLQLEQLYGNNTNRTLESLKEKFGVKDNRHKYY